MYDVPNGMTSFASHDQTHPLNNGYPCRLVVDGRAFTSVEQYMMWCKADTFPGNETVKEDVLATNDYATIKALGRAVVHFDPDVWARVPTRRGEFDDAPDNVGVPRARPPIPAPLSTLTFYPLPSPSVSNSELIKRVFADTVLGKTATEASEHIRVEARE